MISLLDALQTVNKKDAKRGKPVFSIDFVSLVTGELIKIPAARTCGLRANQKLNRLLGIEVLDGPRAGQKLAVKIRLIAKINGEGIFY